MSEIENVESSAPKDCTGKSRQFSEVWNYFTKNGETAECKGCKKEIKGGNRKYGTSSLKRHLAGCKKLKFHDVGQMFVGADGKLKNKKVDFKVARRLLASAVVKHDLPFSFVEYDGIRSFLNYICPSIPCISRNTVVSDINKLYLAERAKLNEVLITIPHRICLTSDVWTSCTSEGYICLTAHFVDNDWKLNSKILNFEHLPPPHSGIELASKILTFLRGWGIEKKIFSLTLDNASSNDAMQSILKDQLNESLLCGGEFFHIRCSAHILNLIVQEGLKIGVEALSKIRDSVKYVKSSEGRKKLFQKCVEENKDIDSSVGLKLDVCTRWNSTYLMLDSALRYKKAFASLQLKDSGYKWCPSNDEWRKGEKLCEFLEPFYETTNLISGTSYPTSNLYFMQVWKIECLLQHNLLNCDSIISPMCATMIAKFEKYWHNYSIVLAFGAVLDPRIKLQLLGYFYSKVEVDDSKCQEKISLVKSKLYKLFESYNSSNSSASQLQTSYQSTSKQIGGATGKLFNEILAFESQSMTSAGKNQLDIYLEEPKLEYKHYQDMDVLAYWKDQSHRFPELALMACDLLAIPITTVASESAFSIGGRVLTKYRSSMLPDKFQTLICTRNWLHGFSFIDGDILESKGSFSCEGSNDLHSIEEGDEEKNEEDFDVDELESF